jgi:hypothetical protein
VPGSGDRTTILGYPPADRVFIAVGIPGAALLIGYLLPLAARWLLGVTHWVLLRPVVRFVGGVDRPEEIAVNLVIWLAIGGYVAVVGWREAARITLDDGEVRENSRPAVVRAEVAAVFTDGPVLVVLDHRSRQRIRTRAQAPKDVLAAAFAEHGYPWYDGDPYGDRYRPWRRGELPAATDALLAVRETLLRKKDHRGAAELRDAAEGLGIAVREDGHAQHWRPLGGDPEP